MTHGGTYFFKIIVTDNGGPPKSTQGDIRLDVFDPDLYAIQFTMKIDLEDFMSQEADFLTELEEILRADYPQCRCILWKAKSVESSDSSTASRRRLLQT